jgi:hypothetical protein
MTANELLRIVTTLTDAFDTIPKADRSPTAFELAAVELSAADREEVASKLHFMAFFMQGFASGFAVPEGAAEIMEDMKSLG